MCCDENDSHLEDGGGGPGARHAFPGSAGTTNVVDGGSGSLHQPVDVAIQAFL